MLTRPCRNGLGQHGMAVLHFRRPPGRRRRGAYSRDGRQLAEETRQRDAPDGDGPEAGPCGRRREHEEGVVGDEQQSVNHTLGLCGLLALHSRAG